MLKVDFHTHTTISDGTLEPAALLRAVASAGLDFFSVSDHDTLGMYWQHGDLLQPFTHKVVTGVEVSTYGRGREVHILGYGVPVAAGALDGILTDRRSTRRQRAERMVEKLTQLGVPISMADVERQAKTGMIGRPHIARALVECGAARDISDAFERYIGSSCPAFMPSSNIAPGEAVQAINRAGGVSVLAHPTRNAAEELLDELTDAGLRGIEVYSTAHTMHDAERLRSKALERKLVMTAGTDFHRPTEANPLPGWDVEESDIADFLRLVCPN